MALEPNKPYFHTAVCLNWSNICLIRGNRSTGDRVGNHDLSVIICVVQLYSIMADIVRDRTVLGSLRLG